MGGERVCWADMMEGMDVNPYESPSASTSTSPAKPTKSSRLWVRLIGYGLLLTLACKVVFHVLVILNEDAFDSPAVRLGFMLYDAVFSLGAWAGIALAAIGVVGLAVTTILRK